MPFYSIGQITIMSYNIRYDNPSDGQNRWENRKKEVAKMINYYSPDLIGTQEALKGQIEYLDSMLPQYNYVGVGRDDGKTKGEYTAIFYNKNILKMLSSKTFWLSETPDTVSIGWDASMERIVTFGEFLNVSNGDSLFVFNAHFDHIGKLSQKKAAELIVQLIESKKLHNKKIIVLGDFNCEPFEEPIKIFQKIIKDSYTESQIPPYGPPGTFNGFNTNGLTTKRIDYIFVKNMEVIQYAHIGDRRSNNLHLSDHLPVLIMAR